MSVGTRVIDIGSGASTFVDDLLDRGLGRTGVLDVAAEALPIAQKQLRDRTRDPTWYVSDVLRAVPPAGSVDLWHDRAVFHFLADPAKAARYAQRAAGAVRIDDMSNKPKTVAAGVAYGRTAAARPAWDRII